MHVQFDKEMDQMMPSSCVAWVLGDLKLGIQSPPCSGMSQELFSVENSYWQKRAQINPEP